MRNYTYQSRIFAELYCSDSFSRCEIVTLHYDGSMESIQMWMITREFERALDGDQDTRRAIDETFTKLIELIRR